MLRRTFLKTILISVASLAVPFSLFKTKPPVPTMGRVLVVDYNAKNGGDGSFERPYNDFNDALNAVKPHARNTVIVMPGDHITSGPLELPAGTTLMGYTRQ